jgi:hypothetical protein
VAEVCGYAGQTEHAEKAALKYWPLKWYLLAYAAAYCKSVSCQVATKRFSKTENIF